MEQHVENVIKEYEQRRQRQMRLERELVQYGIKDPHMKEQMRAVLRRKETNYLRMRRAKLNKNHFKKIKTIGIGAFGEVSLVRYASAVSYESLNDTALACPLPKANSDKMLPLPNQSMSICLPEGFFICTEFQKFKPI